MILIASAASLIFSLVFVFLTIKFCTKHNLYDEVDFRKIHSGNIPRLGGIGLFTASILASAIYILLTKNSNVFFDAPHVLIVALWIFVFALIDDLINMKAKFKFIAQIVAALVVSLSPAYIETIFLKPLPPILGRTLTFCWIIACTNAFNLIDGIDWVCSGISFLSLATLGFIQYFLGSSLYVFYFIIAAATLGFMFWNRPPARIFLGDAGSQTLGFIIATFPLVNDTHTTVEYTKILSMLLLASIPLTDTLAAIWRRTREHRKWFSPDRAHIHHKLLNIGFSKNSAIFFLLFIQAVICAVTIGSMFLSPHTATAVMTVTLFCVELIFITFHYLNRAVNIKNAGHLKDEPSK